MRGNIENFFYVSNLDYDRGIDKSDSQDGEKCQQFLQVINFLLKS